MKLLMARCMAQYIWPLVIAIAPLILIFGNDVFKIHETSFINSGDQRLNFLFLQWGIDWFWGRLPQGVSNFWNFPIFFPYPQSLAFSSNHLGSLPITLLLNELTTDWFFRGNLWIFSCFVLNAGSAYHATTIFLKHQSIRLQSSTILIWASVMALSFAYAAPRVHYLEHAQTLPHFATPYFLLFSWKALAAKSKISLGLAAIFFSWQVYLDIHLALMTALCCIGASFGYAATLLSLKRWQDLRRFLISCSVFLGLVIIICVPLAIPYMTTSQVLGTRPWGSYNMWLTKERFLLKPSPYLDLYEFAYTHFPWLGSEGGERNIFPGLAALLTTILTVCYTVVLCFKSLAKPHHKLAAMKPLVWLIPAYLLLDFVFHRSTIAYAIHEFVPGFNSIRTPARFIVLYPAVISLCTLCLVLNSKVRLLQKNKNLANRAGLLWGVGSILVLLLEAWHQKIPTWQRAHDPLLEEAFRNSQSPVLVLPFTLDPYRNLDYMQIAQAQRIQLGNGYSGFTPESFFKLAMISPQITFQDQLHHLSRSYYKTLIIDTTIAGAQLPTTPHVKAFGPYVVVPVSQDAQLLETLNWRNVAKYFEFLN